MLRPMTEHDIPRVIELCRLMHKESKNYQCMEFSADRIASVLALVVKDGFAVVSDSHGELTGFMAGCAVQPTFSGDFMACDYALYVHPDYRGGLTAGRLLDAYVEWAISKGVKVITAGVSAGCGGDAVGFYESCGFERCGDLLRMEV